MLDEIDRGLIHALQLDGRAPYSRIGSVLGVSTQTVARRYNRLRADAGLRVVGLPDPQHARRAQWLVRLTATPQAAQDLAGALARRPDTSWIKLASGGTEIVSIVHTTPSDGNTLLLHDIPRTAGITSVSAHYLLHIYIGGPAAWRGRAKSLTPAQESALRRPARSPTRPPRSRAHNHSPDANDRAPARAPGSSDHGLSRDAGDRGPVRAPGSRDNSPDSGDRGAVRALGGGDRKLLTALGRDGRATLAELAAQTGWTAATVARRLDELQQSEAIFFDVDVDPAVLGVTTSAMLWMSVPPAHVDTVGQALAEHDELAFVAATTGRSNLVAHALCASPDALYTYLTDRLGALESITALETVPVLRTVKAAAPFA